MTTKEERMPSYRKGDFHCPYCDVYTGQSWAIVKQFRLNGEGTQPMKSLDTSQCYKCKKFAVWYRGQMIDPIISSTHKPNNNMPESVKEIYEEARLVSIHSPRAAATLLRVATERLMAHLGETDGKLDARIGSLQKKNTFDPRVINSFDILRITANEGGAHDGLMDLTGAEGVKAVTDLFFAINYIVEKTIDDDARLDQIYGNLPEDKRKWAEDRNKSAKPKETQ